MDAYLLEALAADPQLSEPDCRDDDYPEVPGAPCVDGCPDCMMEMVEGETMDDTRTVRIPAQEMHEGIYARMVTLRWVCPRCGGPRGEPFETLSYDGSRRLGVHGWKNDCGHVDYYSAVREEADVLDTPSPAARECG